jgi:hypothetical protein
VRIFRRIDGVRGQREVCPLSMLTKTFRFGPVRQETGSKHVRQGDLLEAINVRQTAKAGVYAKRNGFARTAQTFSGGTLSGTPETVMPGTSGNTLMRDTGDQLWARSASTNTWSLMGNHWRPWSDVTTVQSNFYTTPQPFSCLVGSSLWIFAIKTNAYEFSIVDAVTGVVTLSRTAVTATGIVHASAVYDGTNVWVFWVDNGANGTVRCHKFVVATPTVTPTATNYYTFGTTPVNLSTLALQQVQAKYLPVLGKVVVVACGGSLVSTTYQRGAMHSYLDPATGLAVTAGVLAPQQTLYVCYSGATGTHTLGGLYILDGQDGSETVWQYVLAGSVDPGVLGVSAALLKFRVNKTNLTNQTAVILPLGITTSGVNSFSFTCSGFADTQNDKQYVFLTEWSNTTTSIGYYTALVQSSAADSVMTAMTDPYNQAAIASCWVAGGFAKIGTRWVSVTGYDDWTVNQGSFGSEGNSIQRCFHLREFVPGSTADLSKFNICGQIDVGNGPALWHRATGAITVPAGTPIANCVPPMHVVGTTAVNACAIVSGALGYVDLAVMRTDTAKTYGKSCQAMGHGFSPGPIPVTWNGQCPPHEISPLLAPAFLVQSGGTGTDFSIAAAVYAIFDNDGTVWRSSPFVLSATIGHGATLTFPAPPAWMDGTVVYTEIYIGINGTPKLQAVFSPTASMTFTTPTVAAMVNGEILYTTGNALSQTWPVPCQALGAWGNRLFLAEKNVLWTSKELEPGFGPIFNEVQRSPWSDERNDITAIAAVDWNYLGIASANQVAVISGPGPDGVGNGNYVIKTLPSYTGVAAGSVAIQGPQGMYYQNKATGSIQCLQPSLQVMEAAGGAYDYASYSFTVAVWYESENMMLFFAPASSSAIAIDYQHPQDVAPFGQVYLWTFAAGFVTAAACRDDFGLLIVSYAGSIFRPSASQWVDDNASGTTDTYQMKLASAELQIGDLQGSFNLNKLQTLLTMRGASGVSIGTYPGYASATASDARTSTVSIDLPAPTNSGDTESVLTRPPNCMRIQSFRVVVLEKAGVTTQSFEFEGVATECFVNGKLLRPSEGRVI